MTVGPAASELVGSRDKNIKVEIKIDVNECSRILDISDSFQSGFKSALTPTSRKSGNPSLINRSS